MPSTGCGPSGGDRGVLFLSTFAGAALELPDALLVNPYDVCKLSEAIHSALGMPVTEQAKRMHWMRRAAKVHNIYRWAAHLLSDLTEIRIEAPERATTSMKSAPRTPPVRTC